MPRQNRVVVSNRITALVKIPTFISAVVSWSQPTLPSVRVERTHRRRIDDLVNEASQHACMKGDLETATHHPP